MTFLLVGLVLYVVLVIATVGGLICAEPEPADDAADETPTVPLQKRRPLPEPTLAELADDMALIDPATLADQFRRENAHLPR